jgi:hypothetical protein
VRTDISRFYHSVYTHTLEWAAHSKATAKQNLLLPKAQKQQLWGGSLDFLFRDLQGRQSIGIPIGPDVSLIAAELLLARIDAEIQSRRMVDAVRYVDDYEFAVNTIGEAEEVLAVVQEVMAEYELAINPSKTSIFELPAPLEPSWSRALRRIAVPKKRAGQRIALVDLFDAAFELREARPEAHILRFVMGIVRHNELIPENWQVYQSLLLQSMMAEPGIIRETLSELVRYDALGRPLNRAKIEDVLGKIVGKHAPLGHGSEVAWCVWAHIVLGITIPDAALLHLEQTTDSVVALLVLDAESRSLVARPVNKQSWLASMTPDQLQDSGWLLAYEAEVKGWIPGTNVIASDQNFKALQNQGVTFYASVADPKTESIDLSAPGDALIVETSGGGGASL